MLLKILHPKVADRDCEHCQAFIYDEETGLPEEWPKGSGKLRQRFDGARPPCRDPKRGCPKGTPEKPKTLDDRNRDCYSHYLECRAVGSFPDDPLVRQNAAIILQVERAVERLERRRDMLDLFSIVARSRL